MSRYYGDFRAGQTVRCRFNTVGTTGAPATLASGAVTISKDGVDVTPSGGVTLTVDQGGVTGRHVVVIDMTVDATTFSAGSGYAVRLSGTANVGGTSVVGMIVGEWSVENRAAPAADALIAALDGLDVNVASADQLAINAITDGLATADQIPAAFTDATFASAGVFAVAALANAPGGTTDAQAIIDGIVAEMNSVSQVGDYLTARIERSDGLLKGTYDKVDALDAGGEEVGPPIGTVQSGSTGSLVIVGGLPAGKEYQGMRLIHWGKDDVKSGETRRIDRQSYSGGNYIFTLSGASTPSDATNGALSSISEGDLVSPIP